MKKKHFLLEIILKDIAACNSDVKNGICNKKNWRHQDRLIILCLFPLADGMLR